MFVCLPKKTRSRGKKCQKLEKKEEKNNCLSSFHTQRTAARQITTTTYHYHRETERERDGETERRRDFVVVVAKKKKKTTTGFERERSDAREKTKRTVSVWGNSI